MCMDESFMQYYKKEKFDTWNGTSLWSFAEVVFVLNCSAGPESCTTATHDIHLSETTADVSREWGLCAHLLLLVCFSVCERERLTCNDLKELWEHPVLMGFVSLINNVTDVPCISLALLRSFTAPYVFPLFVFFFNTVLAESFQHALKVLGRFLHLQCICVCQFQLVFGSGGRKCGKQTL